MAFQRAVQQMIRSAPSLCTAAFCYLFLSPLEAAKMYRWVDEHGNTQISDSPPPDATQSEHQVMDGSGNVIENKESVQEERAKRKRREQEEAQREQEERARLKVEREQQRRDRVILETFTTERDLEMTRQDRLEAVQVQIRVVEHGIGRLQQQRRNQTRRLDQAKSGSDAAANAVASIEQIENQLAKRREQKQVLTAKQERIRARFAQYLQRFRVLRGDRAGSDSATGAD